MLHGGAGDDALFGGALLGADSGTDTATYNDVRADYTIGVTTSGGFVTLFTDVTGATGPAVSEGHDTLSGIERIQFSDTTLDLTQKVQLFDSSQHLIGTFDTIQGAVNAANNSGETILVHNGTYQEQVHIGAAQSGLTIIGESQAGVIIQAPDALVSNGVSPSNGRDIDGLITVDQANDVTIKTLTVDGADKGNLVTGANNPTIAGIAYLNSDGGVINGVTVEHVREPDASFGDQRGLGIYVSNSNPSASVPTTPSALEAAALNSIVIENSTVSDFQKGAIVVTFANASIHDNIVTGIGSTGLTAQNGIQLSGSTGSVDDNTITGIGYNNPANAYSYAILTFNNRDLVIDGNHVVGTGPADGSAGIAAIASVGAVATNNDLQNVVDAIDVYADNTFSSDPLTPSVTLSNPTGAFDYSSNTVGAVVPFGVYFDPFTTSTDAFNVTGTAGNDELHGGSVADVLTGGAGNEFLEGRGGADTINGGAGNDTIVWNAGDGNDVINGGFNANPHDDTDTLDVATNGSNLTLSAGSGSFTISSGAGNTATVSEVEEVDITLKGGETVTISGDFTGTGIAQHTITIDGSAGTTGETVDASAMTGDPIDISFTGGAGDDTFIVGSTGANLTFNGGAGNDSIDYSHATAGITVDLGSGHATGGAGTDTLSSVENVTATAFADTITGNGSDNTLSGGDGFDTLTGGAGNDTLIGGETGEVYTVATGEGDKAVYSATLTPANIAPDGAGGWTVTTTGEGTDTLSGIEMVQDGSGHHFLLVGNGGFDTFAAAYAEAVTGDTIVLAAGTYAGDVTIDKSISVVGANYNVAGTGTRGAESVLTGHWTVNAGGPVTINGVEFLNNTPYATGIDDTRLTIASSATVTDSVFYNTRPGGDKPISDIAIHVATTAATDTVSIAGNLITGASTGKYSRPPTARERMRTPPPGEAAQTAAATLARSCGMAARR